MNELAASFEDVADWMERHLEEQHDREIGMLMGTMLRAYGRVAAHPHDSLEQAELIERAEDFLFTLCRRYMVSHIAKRPTTPGILTPTVTSTNMIYDTGGRRPRPLK